MSYGVVPAASSLMGANGYLNGHHPLGGEGEAHVEAGERLALLQQVRVRGCAAWVGGLWLDELHEYGYMICAMWGWEQLCSSAAAAAWQGA